MLLIKTAALAMVICIFSLCVKKEQPVFALLLSMGGSICLMALALQKLEPLLNWFQTLAGGIGAQSFAGLLRVLGIALVSQFAASTCKDAGLGSVASAVDLCGRLLALLETAPLLQSLIDYFMRFLQ